MTSAPAERTSGMSVLSAGGRKSPFTLSREAALAAATNCSHFQPRSGLGGVSSSGTVTVRGTTSRLL